MIYGFYYFDIAAVIILLIAMISGAKKGLIKMLFGLLSSLAALAAAVFLVMPVTNFLVENTPVDEYLVQAIKTPLATNLPVLDSQVVYYDHDADPETADILGFYYNGTITPVKEVLEQSPVLKMFSAQIENILKEHVPPEGLTSALGTITSVAVRYALIPVVFIFIWIITAILMHLISKILSTMVSKISALHFLDKVAGVAVSVAYTVVILLAFITLLDMTANNQVAADVKARFVDSSVIGGTLGKVNPFTPLLSKIDFNAWIDKIMASIGKAV
ncbi:MAG: CvpA family protein [Christensenellales bacterium]|jgi:uncharacterized membrane protein required for colicin V production